MQLEPGSTATTYEAYVKTDLYIPAAGELRSVPNAAADSIAPDGAGGYNKVQRVQKYTLQASDIVGSETAGLADVFYTTTTILSGAITLTLSPSGLLTIGTMNQVDYYSRSDIASIGSFSTYTNNRVYFTFEKGTSLASAQAALAGTVIDYELATPVTTAIAASGQLISRPSGTVYIMQAIADAGYTTAGFPCSIRISRLTHWSASENRL